LLARAGARVAVNYRSDDAGAEEFVRETRKAGGEALALAGDVSRPDEARQIVRDVVSAWGRLDVLVNNAGIWEENAAGNADLDVPTSREEIERTIPIGRVGRPEDVAGAILFLVSDLARHVQGEILNVNGGSVLIG